jgi:hypothetical protein
MKNPGFAPGFCKIDLQEFDGVYDEFKLELPIENTRRPKA